MWPSLRPGDALICALARGAFVPGDVVCALTRQGQFLHRVRSRAEGRVVLQGDLSPLPDAALPEGAIFLRALAVERKGRRRAVPARPRWPRLWRRVHAALRRLA